MFCGCDNKCIVVAITNVLWLRTAAGYATSRPQETEANGFKIRFLSLKTVENSALFDIAESRTTRCQISCAIHCTASLI